MTIIVTKFLDSDAEDFGVAQTNNAIHTVTTDSSGNIITVQNPLPTNSDSIYTKNINISRSDNGDFQAVVGTSSTGSVYDYFDSLTSINANLTADNPKSIKIWFERTVYSHSIGLGCDDITKGFGTDVTVKLLGSGEAVRFTKNYTGLDPNSALLEFGPKAFNGFILEFNTASPVYLSNITIQTAVETSTTLQALKPDGTVTNIDATAGGNLKISLEELENQISDDTNTKLKVSPYVIDEFGVVGRMLGDNYFQGSPIVIDVAHHEIHCGDSYEMTWIKDIPNGGTAIVLVIVPDEPGTGQDQKLYHGKAIIDTEAEALIELYEDPTISANGTALNVFNRNRNSTFTDFLAMYHTPTVTTNGTLLYSKRIGSGKSVGGVATRADEFVLKNNGSYLFVITNATTSDNYCNIQLDYYVHPGV